MATSTAVDGYLTKYALTKGIVSVVLEPSRQFPGIMRCTIPGESGRHLSAVEGEWHLSKDEALRDAERRRVSRIVSLKRQVAKLERLAFAEDL